MSAALPRKGRSITPYWLDAFVVVLVVHLGVAGWQSATSRPRMAVEWILSFQHPVAWLVLVLPPYVLLVGGMLLWREHHQRVLIVGGAVLWKFGVLSMGSIIYCG